MYTGKHIKLFETEAASRPWSYSGMATFTPKYPCIWFADGVLTKEELEIVRLNFKVCNSYLIFNTATMMLNTGCSFRQAYTLQLKEKIKYTA